MPAFSLGKRPPWRSVTARLAQQNQQPARPAVDVEQYERHSSADAVPQPLQTAAGWSWRLLVVMAALLALGYVGSRLSEVVIPVLTALLLSAALAPMKRQFDKMKWPDWLATMVPMLVMVLTIGGLLTLVGAQIAAQWDRLSVEATAGFSSAMSWLADGPLHVSQQQMDGWITQVKEQANASRSVIASMVASFGASIGHFMTGLLMTLFATFFFVKDGALFGRGLIRALPSGSRRTVSEGLNGGWRSLVSYVRAAIVVAAVDGVGAGLGALVLGSNLWLAITALTFVCAFVPLIGSLAAGTVAVTVTLITLGWVKAIIMLAIFVTVMSVEAHVLQPLLLGRAVSIHPLVVLLGIAVGIILAGIPGGVFAIPLVAFIFGFWRGIHPENDELQAPLPLDAT